MLKFDHIAVVAPDLRSGAEHVRACLGVDMPTGGMHPQMATHNLLLRTGDDTFLEVIAADPSVRAPEHRRWFNLDDPDMINANWAAGRRLGAWVARTDRLSDVLERQGELLGRTMHISRGERQWDFVVREDGCLPAGGVAPCVLDWGTRGTAAPDMPDFGVRLIRFIIEHPEPDAVHQLYDDLEIENPPEILKGSQFRYLAEYDTPTGIKRLT